MEQKQGTTRLETLLKQRLEKLEGIRSTGIALYPPRYHRTHLTQEAKALWEQQESGRGNSTRLPLYLAGRIVANRVMGKATFMDLRDSSGKIQLYFRQDEVGEEKYKFLQYFDLGDIIGVEGEIFRTRTGEITLKVSDFTLLCKVLRPLPEKWHGLTDIESRYRQRYLDLLSNEEAADIFRTRSRIITAIRRFFDSRGFLEVETPVLWSAAGGASARPFITRHYALDQDFYLRIALELHLKRLIVGGLDKVYEIGRVFRNEGISTQHNPEFTLLESYEAYADYQDVMKIVEELVCYVARETLDTTRITYHQENIELSPSWQCLTLREAIKQYSGIDFEECPDTTALRAKMLERGIKVDSSKGRGKLIDELLATFVEPKLIQPTFVLDYPVELSPLAKRKPDNPHLVERFEAFIAGMEIANAFTELNDPLEQRERFIQQLKERQAGDEEAELPDEDFLLALEHGMPPTGGLGIGIDRLVMLLTNQQSIREVILFPQLKAK